ncbi:MAG TPA: hypothetical protein VJL61_06725 [Rhodanobacteraceae bacterium]|nr:hypothetical protein [Rhodanobacteraceae bacterium]
MNAHKRIPDNSRGRQLLYFVGSLCLVIGTFAALGIGSTDSVVIGWAIFGWAVTAFVFCATSGAILGTLVDIRTLLAEGTAPARQEPPNQIITPAELLAQRPFE